MEGAMGIRHTHVASYIGKNGSYQWHGGLVGKKAKGLTWKVKLVYLR